MTQNETVTAFRELSPAESLSFQPVPLVLQQLVQPPASISAAKQGPDEVRRAREGHRAQGLLSKLDALLRQTEEMMKRSRYCLETSSPELHQRLAQLAKLQTTDRLLDSIECSDACIAQISDPSCLKCLLNAHSALNISLLSFGRDISLEKQRQYIATSILEHFSAKAREALDKIIASGLRSCHETRAQARFASADSSGQLLALLAGIRVENTDRISVYWGDQLFYTALCRETAIVCESLASLALSLSKQLRECMQLGDSGPLTALLQIVRSFISAYERAFSISFSTELLIKRGEACLLLYDVKEMEPYFSTRLKLLMAKKSSHLVYRLLHRFSSSHIKTYVEHLRQTFSNPAAWAPPYPEAGQSLMLDDSAAQHWHITGVSQLFVDFLVLFLGSIFDAFSLTNQVSAFPLVSLHTANNLLAEESSLFARVFTVYSRIASSEIESNIEHQSK